MWIKLINTIVNWSYLLYMTICSTSFFVVVYLIKCKYALIEIEGHETLEQIANILLFIAVPLFMSWLSIVLSKKRADDSIKKPTQSVRNASNTYLSVYLSYFFVALSIPELQSSTASNFGVDWIVLLSLYCLICVFIVCSRSYYFNPLLYFFGYNFYNVVTYNGIHLFVITKNTVTKGQKEIVFPRLKRITDIVYLDVNGNPNIEDQEAE